MEALPDSCSCELHFFAGISCPLGLGAGPITEVETDVFHVGAQGLALHGYACRNLSVEMRSHFSSQCSCNVGGSMGGLWRRGLPDQAGSCKAGS